MDVKGVNMNGYRELKRNLRFVLNVNHLIGMYLNDR